MAREGFVIGFSESTSVNPSLYWNGEVLDNSIDDALLYISVAEARAEAGRLQSEYAAEYHVEAYASSRTIVHTPALPVPTDAGTEGV